MTSLVPIQRSVEGAEKEVGGEAAGRDAGAEGARLPREAFQSHFFVLLAPLSKPQGQLLSKRGLRRESKEPRK